MISKIAARFDMLLERIVSMCDWTYDNKRCFAAIAKSIPLAIIFFVVGRILSVGWVSDFAYLVGILAVSVALVSYYSIEGNKRQVQMDSAEQAKASCTCPYKVETSSGSGIPISRR